VSERDDAAIRQLLADARAAIQGGGSKGAGERLFSVVAAHADYDVSTGVQRALTQVVADLGFADVAIFRARATATHAVRAIELLEASLEK